MSSKFIPPNVGAILHTVFTKSSILSVSTSMSNTSMSAKVFNKSPFPSMTGFDATAPISPNPRTAVPLDITATRFPFEVYLYALSGLSAISKQG